MDIPILYKRESPRLSKKTIEINDGNIIRFSQWTGVSLTFFILSIIFIPGLLGKIFIYNFYSWFIRKNIMSCDYSYSIYNIIIYD